MAFGIDDIVGGVLSVVNKFIPDPEQRAKAESEVRGFLQAADAGQQKVNEQEAASASVFVAGWRPFIGWVCGAALAYQYVLAPLGVWLAAIFGHPLPTPPKLDDVLWQLMFGMLGMGGLRTFEKMKLGGK